MEAKSMPCHQSKKVLFWPYLSFGKKFSGGWGWGGEGCNYNGGELAADSFAVSLLYHPPNSPTCLPRLNSIFGLILI